MAIANFKPVTDLSAFKYQELQNDVSAYNIQINEDLELIKQYKQQEEETFDLGSQIKDEISKIIAELEKTQDEMWAELDAFAGFFWDHANQGPEEIFNQIFEPFLQAVEPLMNVVGSIGLPELPVIGNIQTIIQKIAKMGQLIAKLPKEVRDAAKKEMEDQEKLRKELKKAEADKATAERKMKQIDPNMKCWDGVEDDFKDSKLGKIVMEIVEIFKDILHILQMMCENAVMGALLVILEKLKPIIGMVGDAFALINNAYTVMKMLMFSQAQMLRYFYKTIEEKLSQLNGILNFLICGGYSLPTNFMISAAYSDMVSCQVGISSTNQEIYQMDYDYALKEVDSKISNLTALNSNIDGQIENAKADIVKGTNGAKEKHDDLIVKKESIENELDTAETIKKIYETGKESLLKEKEIWKNGGSDKYYNDEMEKLTEEDEYLSKTNKEMAEESAKLSAQLVEVTKAKEKAEADLAAKRAEKEKKNNSSN